MKKKNKNKDRAPVRRKRSGIVTLITDFGPKGEYSGALKGVILKINPRCQVIDITHQIAPHDIQEASFVLRNIFSYYPTGTVHVVVVDPGVGTKRRPIILKKAGSFFVGPDNGIFSSILSGKGRVEGYEITRQDFFLTPVSTTFHGRDIFAPVAGYLSRGKDPSLFGPRVEDFIRTSWPQPLVKKQKLLGQVLWLDSFGNLITNISREDYERIIEGGNLQIKGKGWKIQRLHRTYGEGQPGEPLALFGSTGFLELTVNQGCARKILSLNPGDPVIITRA